MGHICFVSLFPEYFETAMHSSILGRAVDNGNIAYHLFKSGISVKINIIVWMMHLMVVVPVR